MSRSLRTAPAICCLIALAGALPLRAGPPVPYHRALFRQVAVETGGSRYVVEYDRSDPESVADRDANVELAVTLGRVLNEERASLAPLHPLPPGPLTGGLYISDRPSKAALGIMPVAATLGLAVAPDQVARMGAEAWARWHLRRQLVQTSLARRMKTRGGPVKRMASRYTQPCWLPLGLSYLASEPWTPQKMTMVADALEHGTLIPLARYDFLRTLQHLELLRALNESQAFCQWLNEVVGPDKVASLADAYGHSPLGFGHAFRAVTGMTLSAAQDRFRADALDWLRRCPRPPSTGTELLHVDGRIDVAVPSPNDRRLAFTSNHLRPRGRRRDLFVCDADGGELVFGTDGVVAAPAWSADGRSLFFIRDNVTPRGRQFQQLCWTPTTTSVETTLLRRGFPFRVLLRGAWFSEVSVSPDGSTLALVRQRPSGGELRLFRIQPRPGRSPHLQFLRSYPFDGFDHGWANPSTLAFGRANRGSWLLVTLDVDTGCESIRLGGSTQIHSVDAGGDEILYTVAWNQDQGMALRSLPLVGNAAPVTRTILGGTGAPTRRCSDGSAVLVPSFEHTGFSIRRVPLPPLAVPSLAGLPEAAPQAMPLVEAAPAIDSADASPAVHPLRPRWGRPSTKASVVSDSMGVFALMQDSQGQKRLEGAAWWDRDKDRGNWQLRFTNESRHPGLFASVFNCTSDDFLQVFPLARFTGDAIFRGLTAGWSWDLSARENLTAALEVIENTYLPEFFGPLPVPADLTARANLYRLIYTWDLREMAPDIQVNPVGSRLLRLSFADTPGALESDLRYREFLGDWREYMRLGPGDKDVLAFRVVGGMRRRRDDAPYPVTFRLGGPDTLRGVQKDVMEGRNFLASGVEYRIRLFDKEEAAESVGLLRSPTVGGFLEFDTFYLALFADAGVVGDGRLSVAEVQKGVGIELRAQSWAARNRAMVLRFGYAHGLDDLGEDTFYVTSSTVY